MIQPGSGTNIAAIQERVPSVYEKWAKDHADGLILSVRPYDPSDDYQKVEHVRIEPDISLELAQFLGRTGVGKIPYDNMGAGFEEYRVMETVFNRHKKHKNTLFATLHLRNVLDTATTHNRLFVSSDGNPELAKINDIIANPMMAYLNIGSMAVFRALATSGGVDLALPYKAAKIYGMDKEARIFIGTRARDALNERLKDGVAIHWSPPGTRAKPVILKGGQKALAVSKVVDNVAGIITEGMSWVVPVPVDLHPTNSGAEVLPPRLVETIDDVHKMMEEMVEVASVLANEKIFYGIPDGAIEEIDAQSTSDR